MAALNAERGRHHGTRMQASCTMPHKPHKLHAASCGEASWSWELGKVIQKHLHIQNELQSVPKAVSLHGRRRRSQHDVAHSTWDLGQPSQPPAAVPLLLPAPSRLYKAPHLAAGQGPASSRARMLTKTITTYHC